MLLHAPKTELDAPGSRWLAEPSPPSNQGYPCPKEPRPAPRSPMAGVKICLSDCASLAALDGSQLDLKAGVVVVAIRSVMHATMAGRA